MLAFTFCAAAVLRLPLAVHSPALLSTAHPPALLSAAHAPAIMSRRALFGSLLSLPLVPAASATAAPPPKSSFELESRGAYKAFSAGEYAEAARLWEQLCDRFADQPLAHANLGTCLIIIASDMMTLGELPPPAAAARLERALDAFDTATKLGSGDALLLNSKGNALGLLQRWGEARDAYVSAAAAGPRDFESIPRLNAAAVSFELGEQDRAEREVRTLLLRDPRFVDGTALLATLRYARGDMGGAAAAFERLCEEPMWCSRYSQDSVVLGRWTPAAVGSFRKLLLEPSVQRVIRNADAMSYVPAIGT